MIRKPITSRLVPLTTRIGQQQEEYRERLRLQREATFQRAKGNSHGGGGRRAKG